MSKKTSVFFIELYVLCGLCGSADSGPQTYHRLESDPGAFACRNVENPGPGSYAVTLELDDSVETDTHGMAPGYEPPDAAMRQPCKEGVREKG